MNLSGHAQFSLVRLLAAPINPPSTSMTACGKGLRRFLRQIVPDAARDQPVRIFAREFLGIGTRVRMRRAIGIAFEGDGGHRDDRAFGKPLVQIVIFRLAFSQSEPPAIVMDHDGDMIRIVEGCRAAIERRIVEVPLRRSESAR